MMKLGTLEINKIHLGDCLDLLIKLPDNCIDLVFADPPYNLRLKNELLRPNHSKVNGVNDDWDKFASVEAYDHFTRQWLAECRRVLKPNGCLWLIGTYHNIFRLGTQLQNIGFWILNDVIWVKSNPMPNFKGTRFTNAHETLIWSAKSETSRYTFHYRSMKTMNDDLQMRSDWLIPICNGKERIKVNGQKAHSTQKPSELLRRIILATSNPGDTILDPFGGSGTTSAVAKMLGRRFISFEKEPRYVNIANERLAAVQALETSLLEYKIEKRLPRVSFGNLLEKGLLNIGEFLYSKNEKHRVQIQADGSVVMAETACSTHKMGALLSEKASCNGWLFWYVKRGDNMICIDELRGMYEERWMRLYNSNIPVNLLTL